MIKTIIKKNAYKDSVVLMLLTNEIASLDGVNRVSIMMATAANKDIFAQADLLTDEVTTAAADDIAIVMDVTSDDVVDGVMEAIEAFLNKSDKKDADQGAMTVRNWDKAIEAMPDANLAVFSIPGIYAAEEADTALDKGLNVFLFSDNVTLEDEIRLKKKARDLDLLVMGPDCGTGIVAGVPIAFTNKVNDGSIGVVGASGTGIQEVTTLIDKAGQGITSALGTGGRDLNAGVGGITMLDSIHHLQAQQDTKVILVVSKPPAKEVKETIEAYLRTLDKPVVTLFLGEKPEDHETNIYRAYTLEEAALAAVALVEGKDPHTLNLNRQPEQAVSGIQGKVIKAYYSGGTLASEAAMLVNDALQLPKEGKQPHGFMLNHDGFEIIDLGDDEYTQGRPHPMIDPSKRIELMKSAASDPRTGVVLFDVVLGYGSHADMAGSLAPTIVELMQENRDLKFVATVCGTKQDPQDLGAQIQILEDIGVFVAKSNAHAVLTALQYLGHNVIYEQRPIHEQGTGVVPELKMSAKISELITAKPRIINVGLQSFADNLQDAGATVVQFDWRPLAGGDATLIKALKYLDNYKFTKGA
ncbi:acyl-CoA synthetase FdrA [Erysipelothrix sp. HDW6C]|uniref:acyl-CoA synthetase FdrA n=1 Tax=Erysipelothrix sp. HDW6C TaxID=2714930 RepID=UPI0014078421|nr:acyl-CoA synthetase FdrA [Erysipelothrix sp. HDW6C]QIK69401.1 acyl-CoA synthetase FdrA [Erysipelothrix sp. HDW6C]